MGYEAYRVRKQFDWRGWGFAPLDSCKCGETSGSEDCEGCTGEVGSGCIACPPEACRCACHIIPERFGGEVWIVEDGHPRKELMLAQRYAIYDATLPDIDTLMRDPHIRKLIEPPDPAAIAAVEKKNKARASRIKREKTPAGIQRVE